MQDLFYLTKEVNKYDTWYMLMVKDTHCCVSCGADLDKIMLVMRGYIKKYKTKERFMRTLNELESGKVSRVSLDMKVETYKRSGNLYKDFILSNVEMAYKESREEARSNNPLIKARNLIHKVNTILPKVVHSSPQPLKENKTSGKTIIGRPRVLKMI